MLTSVDVKFISIVHLYREVYEIKSRGGGVSTAIYGLYRYVPL